MLEKTKTAPGENGSRPDAEESARQASLTYVSDSEPGIRRKRSGKGFSFVGANGKPVSDRKTLARIRALVIPPAWTDVWICADPDGHIQATGRDQRGRKQYRYHPRWSASRDEVKYSSLAEFARALPSIRERIDTDLRKRELPRERVVASVVWLLDNTMIRVGNAAYARDNKSFGLTTLRSRHVAVEGAKLRFAFKGKSGKEWKLKLIDRRMAKIIRSIQELPGQHLFQYLDEDGERRIVQVAGRQRLYPRGGRRRFQLEAFPHLGRHGAGSGAVCRDASAGNQERRGPRHERGDRRRGAASRQHPHRLPQMLHPSGGHGVLAGRAACRTNSPPRGNPRENSRAWMTRKRSSCAGWSRERPDRRGVEIKSAGLT